MQLLRRRSIKVGLFFALLTYLFVGSGVYSPHAAAASGEYYQYITSDDTVRVSGGLVFPPAGLKRTGPTSFSGGITVAGGLARISNGNDQSGSAPCQYTLYIDVVGDLKVKGDVAPDFAHHGTADFGNDFPAHGSPGECMSGDVLNPIEFSGETWLKQKFDTDIIIHPGADPRGSAGGQACPGSNAPAGTNCAGIPAGCPGSSSTAKPADPLPPCPFQAVATTDETAEPDLCPVEKGTALRWLACPIIDGGQALTNGLDSIINYFLTINTTQIYGDTQGSVSDPGSPVAGTASSGFYKAWSSFRNLGIGLVVIAGIIMVMSEALGLQIVDAYTIRKVLPRLLIAVIGISLSWSFMYFMVTLFNHLGTGMASLIYSSFDGIGGVNKGTGTAAIFASYFALGGGLLALGFLGILSFLGTLILALIVGVAVLILREGIILMSIIIAPLAIASYVLPNTSKFASFWWSTFFKALAAFPIITGFIAICKVMAIISGKIQ
jgi:hypothetical protein